MPQPTVAIVGRPNVGKSTLFNRLVGRRSALVDDRPGVTRDRREGDAKLLGLEFKVIDTAGYEDEEVASLPGRMRQQTQAAVRSADVALFLLDAREGVTPMDEEIARWLRAEDTPVVLVGNKAESSAASAGLMEAYSLGFDQPVAISAEHGEGVVDLFEALRPFVEREEEEEEPEPFDDEGGPLKLAIVGRPNAGKSTLVNQMVGEERMITGPEAGITRDSISHGLGMGRARPVRLVDTAGMRKRAKVTDKLEWLSDRRRPPLDRACRGRRAAAGRHPRPRSAGPADRRQHRRGRAGADHRHQQMGRGGECLVPVQRDQGGARRGAVAAQGRAGADRLGQDRQGRRPVARRRVRASRAMVAARRDRRAQPLVRSRGREQPAARAVAAKGSSCATSPR